MVLLTGLLVMNGANAEDRLGRLFLTPEQRHTLDARRDPNAPQPVTDLTNATPAGSAVVLNGIVRRSRGSDVVWVNGVRASTAPGQPIHLRRGPDENNRVTLEDAEGTVARLKPGQFWEPATGRVADCYGCTAPPGAMLPDSPVATVTVPAPATTPAATVPPTPPP